MVDNKVFGLSKRMREARHMTGMSQKILAEKLGLHELTYVKYEKGEREPKASVLKDFVKITGVSYDWLFDGIGDKKEDRIKAAFPDIEIDDTFIEVYNILSNPKFSKLIRHKFAITIQLTVNEFPEFFKDKQGEINQDKEKKVMVGGVK